ncbi:MAG: argininosuccinate lyase [Candidatus Hadarchaeales archaeon]
MEGVYRGRVSKPMREEALDFVSSLDEDQRILTDDLLGTLAHVIALQEAGIIGEEGKKIVEALVWLFGRALAGELKVEGKFEDVHEFIETQVIQRVGMEVGGKMHTGRSRNDQVALAVRMRVREELHRVSDLVLLLARSLLKRAEETAEVPIPLYTHTRQAQIGTLGHYFLSKVDELLENFERLSDCYKRVNLCPLGACAIGGTSFPLLRERVAELLGFEGLVENSIQAVSNRDFMLEIASNLSILMVGLSRLAEDLILWSGEEFGFISISEEFASTSSVMPQKVNPCTLELIRAKAAEVLGLTTALFSTFKGLITGYNRDLQETKSELWRCFELAEDSLRVMRGIVSTLEVNRERCVSAVEGSFAVALDLAEALVRERSIPFRTAHILVGRVVRRAFESGKRLGEISPALLEEEAKQLGLTLEVSEEFVRKYTNPLLSLQARKSKGSPNPLEVKRMLAERYRSVERAEELLSERRAHVLRCFSSLLSRAGIEPLRREEPTPPSSP